MGRRPEQTSQQRRYTDGKQAYEKMLHVTCHQGSINSNNHEMSLHACENGQNPKQRTASDAGQDVEEQECSFTARGNAKWYDCPGIQFGSFLQH